MLQSEQRHHTTMSVPWVSDHILCVVLDTLNTAIETKTLVVSLEDAKDVSECLKSMTEKYGPVKPEWTDKFMTSWFALHSLRPKELWGAYDRYITASFIYSGCVRK